MGGGDSHRAPDTESARDGTLQRGEISPGAAVTTDAEILDWVRRDAETALHPSCNAKMGVGKDAVLDPASMRVHGLDGIRVVDASAFPYIPNGNTYAPVMMVAEKSADLILGNTRCRRRTRRSIAGGTGARCIRRTIRATCGQPLMTASALGYAPPRDDRRHQSRRARRASWRLLIVLAALCACSSVVAAFCRRTA